MHPIHYTLAVSIAALLGCFFLAFELREPLLMAFGIVVVFLLGSNTVGKFDQADQAEEEELLYRESKAGFTADIE